ncbi:uncharacterized protein METZ01_LOCUS161641 [marine metagenome]|uniref:Uncharacterized protein n=1 Tax=marine metagenome TaxID=408172 RepID=A0A382B6B7_9ZZZZ
MTGLINLKFNSMPYYHIYINLLHNIYFGM